MKPISRIWLYMCVLLVIAVSASARTDILILDSEIYDGGTITVDDITYTLFISDAYNGETTAFKSSGHYHFVDNNECEFFNTSRVCISEMTNVSTTNNKYKARFKVYSSFANITGTFNVEDTSLFEGEETTLTATVTNNGGHKAVNMSFTIPIPDNIVIVSTERLYQNETHLFFEKDMDADEVIQFEMEFRVTGENTVVFEPHISYFDVHGELKEINLVPETVISEEFCIFDFNASSTSIGVDETANVSVVLYNNNRTNITIEGLKLIVPELVSVYERQKIAEDNPYKYSYKGTIGFNKSRLLRLDYIGTRGGEAEFNLSFRCQLNDDEIFAYIERSIPIRVDEKPLTLNSNFAATEYGEAGSTKLFTLDVFNTYNLQTVTVTHVNITIDNKTSSNPLRNTIPPISSKNLINTTIVLPQVQEDRDVPLTVTLKYKNQNDDEFIVGKNFTLNIYSVSLDVTQSVDKTELFEGEQAKVSLQIDNSNRREFRSVRAYALTELIATDLPDRTFDLPQLTQIDALDFTVVAPFVESETTFTVQTFVEIPEEGTDRMRLYTQEDVITVKPVEEVTNSTTSPLELLGGTQDDTETTNASFSLEDSEEEVTNDFFQSNTLSVVLLILVGVLLAIATLLVKMKSQKKKWKKKQKRYAALKEAFHPKLHELSAAIEKARSGSKNESPKSSAGPQTTPKASVKQGRGSNVEDMLSKLESMK